MRSRRLACSLGLLCALLLLSGCPPIPVIRTSGSGPARGPGRPPRADPARTGIVWAPHVPLPAGKNAVWCATTAAAWQELGRAVGAPQGLDLGPPADPALVAALNAARVGPRDLGPAQHFVKVGVGHEGHERLAAEARAAGLDDIGPPPAGTIATLVAVGSMRRDLPFAHPFRVHDDPMAFAGGPARVVTWGLVEEDDGAAAQRMAAQLEWYERDREDPTVAREYVVVVKPRDPDERIVLARIPRPASLAEGWIRAERLLHEKPESFPAGSQLRIPKFDFRMQARLQSMWGAPVRNAAAGPPYAMGGIDQQLEFRLDERGAHLLSLTWAWMFALAAPPPEVRFDQPFLLALARRGASLPYFLVWVENDDVLMRR